MKAPVIAGKYTLLRKLGAGGMAEVFLAKQHGSAGFEKLVVIKRILPQLSQGHGSGEFLQMFLDEARLASDLRHPNIVTIIDVDKEGGTHYIVMEFLHGQDVRKVQRKNAAWGEQVPIGHACQMVIDAAAGLHYAHNKRDLTGRELKIVHRDVSPQNIIVTYEGATKIVDFGIAKAASQSTHTQTGVLKGKYTYMSPEQAGGEPVDHRTDQFALGIVLWELLTMRRLFKRDSEIATLEAIMSGQVPKPSRFRTDLPPSVDQVVMTALAHDARKRFGSCEELALALEDALATASIAHSQGRLAQYMRRLFADQLAEEATLGLVNPDGSLSKNLTPFTLPPPETSAKDTLEKKEEKSSAKKSEKNDDRREEKIAVVEVPEPTAADRKSARRSSEDSRKDKAAEREKAPERPDKPEKPEKQADKPDKARPPRPRTSDTGPTVVESPPPRRVPSREADRKAAAASSAPLLLIGAGLLAALAVVGGYAGYASWASSGPATLVVRSEPRGAAVFVDGKDTGQVTPALVKGVEAGAPHKIRLELGGRAVEEVVTVARRGATLEVKLDLP